MSGQSSPQRPWRPLSISLRGVGQLNVPTDPLEALATNDAYRCPDVADGPGGDIWPIDEVCRLMPREYDYRYTTFAPPDWMAPEPVTQSGYAERFKAAFPYVAAILPIPHVVVAGGAAAWPLRSRSADWLCVDGEFSGDLDIFIYGIDPNDQSALWRKVSEVMMRLVEKYMGMDEGCDDIVRVLSEGVVSMYFSFSKHCRASLKKVQIILRAYESVSAILHAFDLPSCAVAYDGTLAATTTLGAHACIHRVNVVIPAYRSTTYETRLAKYFSRGYALVLPHLDPGALEPVGKTLELPYMKLTVVALRGPLAVGIAVSTTEGVPVGSMGEDLCGTGAMPYAIAKTNDMKNIRSYAAGGKFTQTKYTSIGDWREAYGKIAIDPDALPATLSEVLPLDRLECALVGIIDTMVETRKVDIMWMSAAFGFDENETCAVVRQLMAKESTSWRDRVERTMTPYRRALLARYDGELKFQWWFTQDPGRQYTASFDPRMADPAEWYGAHVAEPNAQPDNTCDALQAVEAFRHDGFGACGICSRPAEPGTPNIVMMGCGHAYHIARVVTAKGHTVCRGIANAPIRQCPICTTRTSCIVGIVRRLQNGAELSEAGATQGEAGATQGEAGATQGGDEPLQCSVCNLPAQYDCAIFGCGHAAHWAKLCGGIASSHVAGQSATHCPRCNKPVAAAVVDTLASETDTARFATCGDSPQDLFGGDSEDEPEGEPSRTPTRELGGPICRAESDDEADGDEADGTGSVRSSPTPSI